MFESDEIFNTGRYHYHALEMPNKLAPFVLCCFVDFNYKNVDFTFMFDVS